MFGPLKFLLRFRSVRSFKFARFSRTLTNLIYFGEKLLFFFSLYRVNKYFNIFKKGRIFIYYIYNFCFIIYLELPIDNGTL